MTLRTTATEIVRRLQKAGFAAYWVGGCVRDLLLELEPQDYDIATEARPEHIETLFSHTIPVGRQFGVMIVVENNHSFQVATFRAEADYLDGRHPSHVRFGDALADAQRRDFTVNGLFYDPLQSRLYDWVQGQADLQNRILRTIGSPWERFAEDHLRLLRAVRFAAQLGFQIDPETRKAICQRVRDVLTVSAERIRDELLKLFRPPHAAQGLEWLRTTGLLAAVLPEVEATLDCEQSPDYHPEGTVYQHVHLMLTLLPSDAPPSLPWAVLLHDIGKPVTARHDPETGSIHFYGHEKIGAQIAENILKRLRFPRKQTEEIVCCVRQHMQFKDVLKMRKATLRRLLLRPTFPLELELHRLDCLGSHGRLDHYQFLVEQANQLPRQPAGQPPLLTGKDLLALGMQPGPEVGRLLSQVRDKQLQDELTTPNEARDWVRRQLEIPKKTE